MKKNYKILIILILCLICFSSCWPMHPNSVYKTGHPELFTITVNSVLGIQPSDWDEIEILETDSKGRVLFQYYSDVSSYPEPDIYIVLVCQKSDDEFTYYYDDYCFFIAKTKADITDVKIANLKQLNDWDKELQNDKLTKVKSSFDNMMFNEKKEKSLNEMLDSYFNQQEDVYSYLPITTDQYGKQLIYVLKGKPSKFNSKGLLETDEDPELYIMILNKDDSFNKDTFLQELDNEYEYQEQLHKFKILNNWNKAN